MGNLTLEYTLLAQSPMIHFQYEQSGAALRATEVKPKLDRYIVWRAENGSAEDRKYAMYLNRWRQPEQEALSYKMQITANGQGILYEDHDFPLYYGNMGRTEKRGLLSRDVKLRVLCFDEKLREFIDAIIGDFFLTYNFGTMQGKGFGSFVVEGRPVSPAAVSGALKSFYQAKKCYSFQGGDVKTSFAYIKTVYSLMKSGINVREYKKSLLFCYLYDRNIGNEKAALKQSGIAPAIGKHSEKTLHPANKENPHYVRALLGVGGQVKFLKDLNNWKDKETITIEAAGKDGEAIERLMSPIFFKVVGSQVYYLARPAYEGIYGAKFVFSNRAKEKLVLSVPAAEELGEDFYDDFLDYCMNDLNRCRGAYKMIRIPQIREV